EASGLIEYPQYGLGSVTGLALVFETESGIRMKQMIAPAPADWVELRSALLKVDGVMHARIDTQGVITVTMEDGSQIRALMDYVVTHGDADTQWSTLIEEVGDISGNGVTDYRVV